MSEALARDAERAGGFLHLVRLVPRRLGVLHLRDFHVLSYLVEVFLGLLELANIPDGWRRDKKKKTNDKEKVRSTVKNQLRTSSKLRIFGGLPQSSRWGCGWPTSAAEGSWYVGKNTAGLPEGCPLLNIWKHQKGFEGVTEAHSLSKGYGLCPPGMNVL